MPEVEDNYDNENICIKFCGVCPTYPGVKGELLFCARGKSSAPKQKSGCNCGLCDMQNNKWRQERGKMVLPHAII